MCVSELMKEVVYPADQESRQREVGVVVSDSECRPCVLRFEANNSRPTTKKGHTGERTNP